jgi:peroxiredoxin
MSQSSTDILLRIERLLNAGKQQEARLLLVDYIKSYPSSAHAWWLMSLTLNDTARQIDCLQRALHLDPHYGPARERLAKLASQPPTPSSVNPFHEAVGETRESISDALPAWAVSAEAVQEAVSDQAGAEQPAEPVAAAPAQMKKRRTMGPWLAVLAVLAIGSLAVYAYVQQKDAQQAQERILQETQAMSQLLTSLPLPTRISTWTASPSWTALPTFTFTPTITLTPTLEFTSTRTPRPASLVGPAVGLYAPDFNLIEVATGQRVTLSQFDGQPVLIFFWTSVCSQCDNEMASIETIAQNYKDAGLVVLTINPEDPATINYYRVAHGTSVPILSDADSAVKAEYSVSAFPWHVFINASGRITFTGWGQMTLETLKTQVNAILHRYPTTTP